MKWKQSARNGGKRLVWVTCEGNGCVGAFSGRFAGIKENGGRAVLERVWSISRCAGSGCEKWDRIWKNMAKNRKKNNLQNFIYSQSLSSCR